MDEKKVKWVKISPEAHSELKKTAKDEGRILEAFTTELLLEALKIRKERKQPTEAAA